MGNNISDISCPEIQEETKFHAGQTLYIWIPVLIVTTILSCYVFFNAATHKERRKVPAYLMIARTFADLLFACIFFYMIIGDFSYVCYHCSWLAPAFLLFFLISELYFASICYDIYRTLTNPFKKPLSDTWRVHIICWIIPIIVVSLCSINDLGVWGFRRDYQICFIQSSNNTINTFNVLLLYIPTSLANLAGIWITVWSWRRLKTKVLDETFELRWTVLRRQFVITACYTLGYIIALSCWFPIVIEAFTSKKTPRATFQPYCFLGIVVVQSIADASAWYLMEIFTQRGLKENERILKQKFGIPLSSTLGIDILSIVRSSKFHTSDENNDDSSINNSNNIHNNINNNKNNSKKERLLEHEHLSPAELNELEKQRNEQQKKKKEQDLSNALRREVVAYMTSGLAYSVKRTAMQTQQARQSDERDDFEIDIHASQVSELSNLGLRLNPHHHTSYGTNYHQQQSHHSSHNYSTGNDNETDNTLELNNSDNNNTNNNNNNNNNNTTVVFREDLDDRTAQHVNDMVLQDNEKPVMRPFNRQITDEDSDYDDIGPLPLHDTQQTPRDDIHDHHHSHPYDSILTIIEDQPPQVFYAETLRQNPKQHKGTINQYQITIDMERTLSMRSNQQRISHTTSHRSSGQGHTQQYTLDEEFDLLETNENNEDKIPFTDFSPHVFRYLRQQIYKISDIEYLESISPCSDKFKQTDIVAKFSEGRSGAFFFFTYDMKYIIKTLTYDEASLLLEILPKYVEHMNRNRNSYVNKFFGLHSIKLYNLTKWFVVMENVFVNDLEPQEKYDLKGSWIDRHTNHHVESGKLMKDEDLHKTLILDPIKSNEIYLQLYQDTLFLESVGIMDYSLLLGIYYMGIDPEKIHPTKDDAQKYFINDNISHHSHSHTNTPHHNRDESQLSTQTDEDGYALEDRNNNEYDDDSDDQDDIDEDNEYSDQFQIPPELMSNNIPLNNEWRRPRAQTFFTGMRKVGQTAKAVPAKMIEGPGIYYMGVIDMLQKWNTSKRMERLFKVYIRGKNKYGISCVEPKFYRVRFLNQMIKLGIRPTQ